MIFFEKVDRKMKFPIQIRRNLDFVKLVKSSGFDRIAPEITKKTNLKFDTEVEDSKIDVMLLRFKKPKAERLTSEEIFEVLEKNSLRPLTLCELIIFANSYKKIFSPPIVALGTFIKSRKGLNYASIWGGSDFKNFDLTSAQVSREQFSKKSGNTGSYCYAVVSKGRSP